MKSYGVLCIPDMSSGNINVTNVIVDADSPEGAKEEAIKVLKKQGYSNPRIAPELPGTTVVRERGNEDHKQAVENNISLIRKLYPTFEEKVNKARSLFEDYVNALINRGVETKLAEDFIIRIIKHFLCVNNAIKYNELALFFGIFKMSLTQEIFNNWNKVDRDANFIEEYLSDCNQQEKAILYQLALVIYTVDEDMTDAEYNYLSNFLN